ncbi:hypothetical protein [Methanotorris igneus]|uniref:Uncharacterized protein n=1 Tax=Methanotorris igneus (strain DSM 5666 / JCM 11834 / Kol 5) TaxID=880724 RepID=F6BAR6_METIK|nr:hypothetical protein [Methanotorris igneus]AEF95880.1 hypothetical protein Metig_0324 [Methanotorris igneus Kol 5]
MKNIDDEAIQILINAPLMSNDELKEALSYFKKLAMKKGIKKMFLAGSNLPFTEKFIYYIYTITKPDPDRYRG